MEWRFHANCDPEVSGCYVKAGQKLNLRLKVGPPSFNGLSYMKGIYTEPLTREKDSELTSRYFDERVRYDNSPDKSEWAAPRLSWMPPWMKLAWVACAVCWALVFISHLSQ